MYLEVQVALGVLELLSLPFPLLYQAVHHVHFFQWVLGDQQDQSSLFDLRMVRK